MVSTLILENRVRPRLPTRLSDQQRHDIARGRDRHLEARDLAAATGDDNLRRAQETGDEHLAAAYALAALTAYAKAERHHALARANQRRLTP